MRSCSTSSSIEEYSLKVACEAKMDINLEIAPNESWADQVNAAKPIALCLSNTQSAHETLTLLPSNPAPYVTSHGNTHKHIVPSPNTSTVILYDVNQLADPSL